MDVTYQLLLDTDQHGLDSFKRVDANHYICFTVLNEIWRGDAQRFVEKKLVVFDNEGDAKRCLDIMDEYATRFWRWNTTRNTMTKDMFVFDGATLHLISGHKVEYDEVCRVRESIQEIERAFPAISWRYMDAYANVFGYKARRTRSFWSSLLRTVFFCCCFGQDVFTYVIPRPEQQQQQQQQP